MRAVVQRVNSSSVLIDDRVVGSIDKGILIGSAVVLFKPSSSSLLKPATLKPSVVIKFPSILKALLIISHLE